MSQGRVRSRFNLLCLQHGEEYFEDGGVNYTAPANDPIFANERASTIKGRLKICSASLVFEPDTIKFPVVKFMYQDIVR